MIRPDLAANPLATRRDVQDALLGLWAPLRPFFAAAPAAPRLGDAAATYGEPAALLESFARPLWGIAPFVAGGGVFPDWPLYHRGITAGVDPASPDYWGELGDLDQRAVEMAALGLTLALCPDELWTPLDNATRGRLAAWLFQINHRKLVNNNWLFFRVLVNDGLRRVGAPHDAEQCRRDLAAVDGFYQRDGWYSDGIGGNRDYYIPMAIHYYGLIHTRLDTDADPARVSRVIERARLFAPQFAAWFAPDGAALPFGRSLAYRFAQGAFWGALAFTGTEALPWGVIKGLYLRHLRWWLSQPMFTESGLLSIGYAYPSLIMADRYNAPGSPYWACKIFLPLALPDTHPFWKAAEQPFTPPAVLAQSEAKLLLCHDSASRHLFALGGHPAPGWDPRHGASKYSKICYSTLFGFGVPCGGDGPEDGGGDSVLLLSDDARHWRSREEVRETRIAPDYVFSRWSPFPDVEVSTWLAPAGPGHVRVHHIRTARSLHAFEGGFSLARLRESGRRRTARGRASVSAAAGLSALADLTGQRDGVVIDPATNTHLLHPRVALPGLRGKLPPGDTWLVCCVLGLPAESTADLDTYAAEFTVNSTADALEVRQRERIVLQCSAPSSVTAAPLRPTP